jgi:hypothetical protein
LWHGFALGTQAVPATQTLHVPPRHTSDPPHAAASGWNAASVQTGAPLAQTVDAAVAQGLEDVQAPPSVHAVQTPLVLQTPVTEPEVHDVPALANVASTHTGAPVEQPMVAVSAQGLLDVHAAPVVQATHVPAGLHTPVILPLVQDVPAARKDWSVQTGPLLPHAMVALVAQGFAEVQDVPEVQAVQIPMFPVLTHTPGTPPDVQAVPPVAKI